MSSGPQILSAPCFLSYILLLSRAPSTLGGPSQNGLWCSQPCGSKTKVPAFLLGHTTSVFPLPVSFYTPFLWTQCYLAIHFRVTILCTFLPSLFYRTNSRFSVVAAQECEDWVMFFSLYYTLIFVVVVVLCHSYSDVLVHKIRKFILN